MAITINGDTGVSGVDGTVSNPALEGSDPNTGLYFPAADTVAVGTNGSERMRIDSSGNVGIGTTSPATTLNVVAANTAGTDNIGNVFIRTTDSYAAADVGGKLTLGGYYNATSTYAFGGIAGRKENAALNNVAGYLQFLTTTSGGALTERMRIDSSGNVGIGTSSPGQLLTISGAAGYVNLTSTTGTNVSLYRANNTGGYAFFGRDNSTGSSFGSAYSTVVWANGAYPMLFATNDVERMRIDSSGNLLVGTTSGAWIGKVSIASDSSASYYPLALNNTASGSTQYNVVDIFRAGTRTGTISNTNTATFYNTSSDYRLKENVQPMTAGLAKVKALKPVTYDWISDKSYGEGFIAHELQSVIPLAVTGEKDAVDKEGNIQPQGVDYSKIVVHLVAAMQEQQAQITSLKAELDALKAKVGS